MALINLETTLQRVCRDVQKIGFQQGVEILSYKRNRGIAIVRLREDTYLVRERGYRNEEWQVGSNELPKLLKTLFKREFPRSRKVRLYQLAGLEEAGTVRKIL